MKTLRSMPYQQKADGLFIAANNGFICSDCMTPAEIKTLGDSTVEV